MTPHNAAKIGDGSSNFAGVIPKPLAVRGIYGLRPTAGMIPFWPLGQLFVQQVASAGPMARTVKDMARVLPIRAGNDDHALLSVNVDAWAFAGTLEVGMTGKKIAWLGGWNGCFAMDQRCWTCARPAARPSPTLAARWGEAMLDFDPAELWETWLTPRAWIIGTCLGHDYAEPALRPLMKDPARWEVQRSFGLGSDSVFEARMSRTRWHGRGQRRLRPI